jgi:hypothetical protein
MANKKWVVDFNLVNLKAGKNWQSVEVEATGIGQAVKKAWDVVRTRNGVKGKRVNEAKVSIRQEIET